jgi:uncharacterized membrane-anchored protein YitT (DUF2179 family)
MPASNEAITGNAYKRLRNRILVFLAVLVIVRFVLEVSGTPATVTRYVSSIAGLVLAAIYLAAIGPLKGGLLKFSQLILPALLLSAWTVGWVILFTLVSGVFRLQRSHFAGPADYGNWGHLGHHILEHVIEIGVLFVVVLVLMAFVHLLWRWPVTVGPGAILGALVVIRYWLEAMGVPPASTAAWSSTVGILLAAFYLGGVGPRLGLAGGGQLFVPALVLGWTWRLWVFIATLMSAFPHLYTTHFFNRAAGNVPMRLLAALGGTVVEGFIAGLIVWGIAAWIACAMREAKD